MGLLELRPLTWDSPASLLEKLILYEAVHEITSWDDLRHRVAPDRRCYAYFHPQMPGVPLIFVEVAFAGQMAGNVQRCWTAPRRRRTWTRRAGRSSIPSPTRSPA